ncbi:MAG: hypothetical protein QNL12_07955, partial [Acidimicrobiia bacterium]|nr:hypothetical protein [Acidimicrobiia bacterium]
DCSAMSEIDSTATIALVRLAQKLEKQGVGFWITHIRDRNWDRAMAARDQDRELYAARFDTNTDALRAFQSRSDHGS